MNEKVISTITEPAAELITSVIKEGIIEYVTIIQSFMIHEFSVNLTEGAITEIDTTSVISGETGYPFTKCMLMLVDPLNGNYNVPILRQKVVGDSDILEVGFPADTGETISGLKLNAIFYNN